jgi:hypothetical protein
LRSSPRLGAVGESHQRHALSLGEQFRITPEVISVLDYRKGFGHTDLVKI